MLYFRNIILMVKASNLGSIIIETHNHFTNNMKTTTVHSYTTHGLDYQVRRGSHGKPNVQ